MGAGLTASPAAAQTALNLNALQGLVPFSTLLNTTAGQSALTANYNVTGAIQNGTDNQPGLMSFALQQQQALKDATLTTSNAYQLADGLGSKPRRRLSVQDQLHSDPDERQPVQPGRDELDLDRRFDQRQ